MNHVESLRSKLKQNGFVISKTFGSSMRPLIWGGQHCVAVAPIEGEPRVGDLLMFVMTMPDGREKNIVHRLVKKMHRGDERLYITRGDNCLAVEYVFPPQVIGRVAEVHRVSGFRPWHIIPTRKFTVADRSYLLYSRLWSATWPVRRVYYLCRAHAYGLIGRLRALLPWR